MALVPILLPLVLELFQTTTLSPFVGVDCPRPDQECQTEDNLLKCLVTVVCSDKTDTTSFCFSSREASVQICVYFVLVTDLVFLLVCRAKKPDYPH